MTIVSTSKFIAFVHLDRQDLASALKRSKATWKIVIGHHAIRSVSEHGDTQELVQQLLPILKVCSWHIIGVIHHLPPYILLARSRFKVVPL